VKAMIKLTIEYVEGTTKRDMLYVRRDEMVKGNQAPGGTNKSDKEFLNKHPGRTGGRPGGIDRWLRAGTGWADECETKRGRTKQNKIGQAVGLGGLFLGAPGDVGWPGRLPGVLRAVPGRA